MMTFTKRAAAIVLSVSMVATAFTGCGGGTPSSSAATSANSAAPSGTGTPSASGAPEVVYRINCTQSVDLFEQLQQEFAKNVTEMSGGRIGFEFIPTGSIGSSNECITSCQMGTLDFVNGGSDELGSIVPNSDWAQLPFFITSHEQAQKEYLDGFIGEFANKQYAESGLISVSRIDNSFRTVGIKGKNITSSADLKGLRIRVPNQPLALRMYELMGALPVAMAASEVLIALEQGTVDGADNAVLLFDKFNLYDSFDSIVLLRYGFGSVNIFCSAETWETIPEEDQKLMMEAGKKAAETINKEVIAQEEALIERAKAEGKHIIEPDDAWKEEMYNYADVIWKDALDSGKYDETFINQLYALYQENTK